MCKAKLTSEDHAKIEQMLISGATYEDAGRAFGISRQRVHQIFSHLYDRRASRRAIVYPNLNRWMLDKNYAYADMAEELDISVATLASYVHGAENMPKVVIDKMIELTGIPYEKLFAKTIPENVVSETLHTVASTTIRRKNIEDMKKLKDFCAQVETDTHHPLTILSYPSIGSISFYADGKIVGYKTPDGNIIYGEMAVFNRLMKLLKTYSYVLFSETAYVPKPDGSGCSEVLSQDWYIVTRNSVEKHSSYEFADKRAQEMLGIVSLTKQKHFRAV